MSLYKIKDWTDDDCVSIQNIFEKLSGKYMLLIVSILVLEGRKSYGDLKRDLCRVSSKTLTERLQQLVSA